MRLLCERSPLLSPLHLFPSIYCISLCFLIHRLRGWSSCETVSKNFKRNWKPSCSRVKQRVHRPTNTRNFSPKSNGCTHTNTKCNTERPPTLQNKLQRLLTDSTLSPPPISVRIPSTTTLPTLWHQVPEVLALQTQHPNLALSVPMPFRLTTPSIRLRKAAGTPVSARILRTTPTWSTSTAPSRPLCRQLCMPTCRRSTRATTRTRPSRGLAPQVRALLRAVRGPWGSRWKWRRREHRSGCR